MNFLKKSTNKFCNKIALILYKQEHNCKSDFVQMHSTFAISILSDER